MVSTQMKSFELLNTKCVPGPLQTLMDLGAVSARELRGIC